MCIQVGMSAPKLNLQLTFIFCKYFTKIPGTLLHIFISISFSSLVICKAWDKNQQHLHENPSDIFYSFLTLCKDESMQVVLRKQMYFFHSFKCNFSLWFKSCEGPAASAWIWSYLDCIYNINEKYCWITTHFKVLLPPSWFSNLNKLGFSAKNNGN